MLLPYIKVCLVQRFVFSEVTLRHRFLDSKSSDSIVVPIPEILVTAISVKYSDPATRHGGPWGEEVWLMFFLELSVRRG
jgi:hypothetical protein